MNPSRRNSLVNSQCWSKLKSSCTFSRSADHRFGITRISSASDLTNVNLSIGKIIFDLSKKNRTNEILLLLLTYNLYIFCAR